MTSLCTSHTDWIPETAKNMTESIAGEKHVDLLCQANSFMETRKQRSPQTMAPRVDTGFAWVVLLAACLIQITIDGFTFTLNILFPIFLDTFKESAAMTSLVASVLTGVMLLSGPINSYLISRFGRRLVCFVGAIVAAAGAGVSSMATSILYLILTLGLLTGYGFDCMNMAAMISMLTWFKQRRAIAMGIQSVVSGIGWFIFPRLITSLNEELGLQGYFLITAGIMLQGCIFALLLRPAPPSPDADNETKVFKFDFKIFRNWKYDLYLVHTCLFTVGCFPLMSYMSLRAVQIPGVSLEDAEFLSATIIPVANMVGRLSGTIFLGRKFINNALLLSMVELLGSAAICLSVLSVDYTTQVVSGVAYGLVQGFGMMSLGVVMADLVPDEHIPIASGFFICSLGLNGLAGGPFAGLIFDNTYKSFTNVFLVMGSLVLCSGVLLFVIWFAQSRSTSKSISFFPRIHVE